MKIQLQPNVVNDVTDLASLSGGVSAYIQYLKSDDETTNIYFATSKAPITSLSSSNADCFIDCDQDSIQSTKAIKIGVSERLYAWYSSNNVEPVSLIVTDKQVVDVGYSDNMPDGIFEGFRAITVQPYTEANVKNGVQFYARRAFTGDQTVDTGGAYTALNQKRYVYFQTGSKPVIVKDRVVKYIGEEFALRIYNATGQNAPVTAGQISITNYRADGLGSATTVSAHEVLEADTAGILGTPIGDPEYYFGSAATGQRNPDSILEGRERLLPINSAFYVEIELTAGTTGRFEYFLDWYEGGADLPLPLP